MHYIRAPLRFYTKLLCVYTCILLFYALKESQTHHLLWKKNDFRECIWQKIKITLRMRNEIYKWLCNSDFFSLYFWILYLSFSMNVFPPWTNYSFCQLYSRFAGSWGEQYAIMSQTTLYEVTCFAHAQWYSFKLTFRTWGSICSR